MSGTHAKLSPSGFAGIIACPGKPNLLATLPVELLDSSSEASAAGTAKHEVLQNCLDDNVSPASFKGKTMLADGFEFLVDDEFIRQVQIVYNYIIARKQTLRAVLHVEAKVDPGAAFHTCEVPTELWPDDGTQRPALTPAPRDDCSGSADAVLIGSGILEVVDAKFGSWPHKPENHIQMMLYALGALKLCLQGSVQRVVLTIAQPTSRDPSQEPIASWEVHPSELEKWAVDFQRYAALTDDPNAPRIPGDSQCKFCPGKVHLKCPEVSGAALTALQGIGHNQPPVTLDAVASTTDNSLTDDLVGNMTQQPDTLSPAQKAAILDSAGLIRSWLKAVEASALEDAKRGEAPPGYKAVRGTAGHRKWALDDEAMKKKLANVGRIGEDGKTAGKLPRSEYIIESVISMPQAEKHIKPKVSGKTWNNLLKLVASRGEGPIILVGLEDERPEIATVTDEEVFGVDDSTDLDWLS